MDDIVEKHLINPKAKLHNNYIHKSIDVDLVSVYDWVKKTKPIVAGFGVFFKNQDESMNPVAVMIENFIATRKKYKDIRDTFHEESYEYETYDRYQSTEKINPNSLIIGFSYSNVC